MLLLQLSIRSETEILSTKQSLKYFKTGIWYTDLLNRFLIEAILG